MNIVPFSFQTNEVRLIVEDGKPWFPASDIAKVLEHSDASMMCKSVPRHWKDTKKVCTHGGEQKVLCLSESGLYKVVMRSNKPQAQVFQDWVCGEVLPSIRETGSYGVQKAEQLSITPTIQEIAETTSAILSIAGLQPYLIAGAVANAIAKQYPERKQIAEEAKKFLPLPVEDELLTATNLAKKYVEVTGKQLSKNNTDHGNAIAMNSLLLKRGLQTKNPNPKAKKDGQPAYLPTELGKQYGELVLQEATATNKTVQQLRWYPSVIDFLG